MKLAADSPAKSGLAAALLVGAVLLLYVRTWSYGFSYLDDNLLIVDQAAFLSDIGNWVEAFRRTYLGSPSDTYYRPIVNVSFLLDGVTGGIMPAPFHVTNTLLHVVNCLLLLRVLGALGFGRLQALAGAGIFALHPVQVTSVAWIPGRNDQLLGIFALLSLLSLLRVRQHGELWAKVAHLGCFTLALFTKETAVFLPLSFVLVAFDSRSRGTRRRALWLLSGWIVALVVYFVARARVVQLPAGYAEERLRVVVAHFPLLLTDLGKLVLPWQLKVLGDPKDALLWPGVVAVALVIAVVALVHGCRRHVLALAGVLVLCPLLVSLPGTRYVLLDNRLHLPIVGVALLVAEVMRASQLRTRWIARGTQVVLLATCTLCVRATRTYAEKYRSRESFSEAAMQSAPQSPIAIHLRFRQSYARELEGLQQAAGR